MVSPPRPMSRPIDLSADEPGTEPDFRLEETLDGWTLRISLGDRLLDALAAYADEDAPTPTFTVAVYPNLVPGDPFPASVVITRPPTV